MTIKSSIFQNKPSIFIWEKNYKEEKNILEQIQTPNQTLNPQFIEKNVSQPNLNFFIFKKEG